MNNGWLFLLALLGIGAGSSKSTTSTAASAGTSAGSILTQGLTVAGGQNPNVTPVGTIVVERPTAPGSSIVGGRDASVPIASNFGSVEMKTISSDESLAPAVLPGWWTNQGFYNPTTRSYTNTDAFGNTTVQNPDGSGTFNGQAFATREEAMDLQMKAAQALGVRDANGDLNTGRLTDLLGL